MQLYRTMVAKFGSPRVTAHDEKEDFENRRPRQRNLGEPCNNHGVLILGVGVTSPQLLNIIELRLRKSLIHDGLVNSMGFTGNLLYF